MCAMGFVERSTLVVSWYVWTDRFREELFVRENYKLINVRSIDVFYDWWSEIHKHKTMDRMMKRVITEAKTEISCN